MNNTDKTNLLKKLQALEFAVIEAALFLDSHPTDAKALDYYNKMIAELNVVKNQYVDAYGPLTIKENTGNRWQWVDGPWPWEMEA